MTPLLFGLAASLSTSIGGWVALRFKDRLHLILSFSAGAVIGVAFFDLLPEALALSGADYDVSTILTVTAAGFVAYLLLNSWLLVHSHDDEHCENPHHKAGKLGAGSLSLHSLLDGVAIGLAFKASPEVGLIVAMAVLVHDFSDGINTVGFILKNKGEHKEAVRWLTLDALAPLLGIILTFFISVPDSVLGLILAVFAGFFLYIGASDLLPESHHHHPAGWTSLMTVLGMAVLYFAVRLGSL